MARILIVGARTGIGLEMARLAHEAGHHVFGTSRTGLVPYGTAVLFDPTEANTDTIQNLGPLDALVYCPGTITLKPFHRLSEIDIATDFAINVQGAVRCIQATLPQLKSGVTPSITLFSTVAVSVGMPYHASIAMAKAALEGLVRSLASEYAPLIRVNAIAPSLTDTPLAARLVSDEAKREASGKRHPLQRIGTATEVARAALFVAIDATWTTGATIPVDGGMSSLRQ
jgi:NAD(P)-dependent dehydrogenase (short-subunit alcohol dehydrogenase family)